MKNILLILLILPGIIFGQYNEKEILKKQASSYISRRQYEKANGLYEQILKDDPKDTAVAELYITNLLRISKFSKAEEKIAEYRSIMPEITRLRLQLPINISRGEFKTAKKTALDFLDKNRGNVMFYQILATSFSQYRQNDIAIEIYKLARTVTNDEFLYTRELAQSYNSNGNFADAVVEYFKLLQKQGGYSNYILNRLISILQEDPQLIKIMNQESKKHPDPKAREIYAFCLAEMGDFDGAMEQYEELDIEKLYYFAQKMSLAGRLSVAEMGFDKYISKATDPVKKATAGIDLAKTLIKQVKYQQAKELLLTIYSNKEIQNRKYKFRSKANRECREMLADLVLREKGNEKLVISYLEDAKNYSFNKTEINEIEFKIINLLMLIERYDESKAKLTNLVRSEEPGTDSFKKGYLYSYLLAVFQKDASADSLLGEIIINLPENEAVNDALLMANLIVDLNPETVDDFLFAYRQKMIYRELEAINLLQNVYDKSGNEEMLFLAGEWAGEANLIEKAESIFSHPFENEIIAEYATLLLTKLKADNALTTDFLLHKPQSVFSPMFRKIMVK